MRQQHPIWTAAGIWMGTIAIGAVLAFGIPAAFAPLGITHATDGAMDGPVIVVMVLGGVGALLLSLGLLSGTLYLGFWLVIGPHILGRLYLDRERHGGRREQRGERRRSEDREVER